MSLALRPSKPSTSHRISVDDYEALLDRAVRGLGPGDAAGRSTIYGRARGALLGSLRSPGAAMPEADIAAEGAALDRAIARIEARCFAAGPDGSAPVEALAQVPAEVDLPLLAAVGAAVPPAGRRQFAANAAASAAVSLFKTGLQIAMVPLMARLLGPTAYGIYALAFPTVMFFMVISDGGLGVSLAREDENNRLVWSTAFWALLGSCCVLALAVVGIGFVLASISGQPSLVGLMAFLSLALPLIGLALPADARLVRRGNLLFHSGSDLVGSVVGAGVALTLAYRGAGAWALAAQFIASFALRTAILNAAAWSPPDLAFDLASLRGHVSTGGALLISRIGELGSKLAENAVYGHVFGTAGLGTYTLANQVSRFSCEAVTNPVVGAFYAQALRESDEDVALLHAKMTRLLLLVLLPATALMAVCAPRVFPLVLGDRWVDAAPLFQAIVVAYALASVAWLSGQILLKHGMTDRSAAVVVGCGMVRVAVVAAGLWLQPVWVAWLVGGSYLLQAVVMTLAVPRGFGSSLGALCAALRGPAAAAAAGTGVTAALLALLSPDMASAVAASALGGACYIALLFVFDAQALRGDLVALTRALRRRPA